MWNLSLNTNGKNCKSVFMLIYRLSNIISTIFTFTLAFFLLRILIVNHINTRDCYEKKGKTKEPWLAGKYRPGLETQLSFWFVLMTSKSPQSVCTTCLIVWKYRFWNNVWLSLLVLKKVFESLVCKRQPTYM